MLHVLNLVLLAACSCQVAAAARGQFADHNDFINVFGKHRVNAHFPTASHFNAAVEQSRRAWTSDSGSDDPEASDAMHHHALVCVGFQEGRAAKLLLDAALAQATPGLRATASPGVHTAYASAKEGSTCFLVAASGERLLQLQDSPEASSFGRWSWTPVPVTLKAHHSAMQRREDGRALVTEAEGEGTRTGPEDYAELEMLVAMGAGGPAKQPVGAAAALASRVLDRLGQGGAAQNLQTLDAVSVGGRARVGHGAEALTAHPSGAWSAASAYLASGAAPCNWSGLRLDAGGRDGVEGSIVVGGLEALGSTPRSRHHCVTALVAGFVSDGAVADVRFSALVKPLNAEGKSLAQAGTIYNSGASAATNFPYNAAGLNGTNVVIGVADSGLDDLHCFFIDNSLTQTPRSPSSAPVTYPSRRKVIQYVSYVDGSDEALGDGHGTHVAGTVAGKNINNADDENGHAPEAKIAFFDVADPTASSFSIPQPYSIMFNAAVSAGAQLHSNSWGAAANMYTTNEVNVDQYHYNNAQFLAVFAAGNDGADGYYSTGRPALAKNVLTVGATMDSSTSNMGAMAYFSSIGPTFDGRIKPEISSAGFPVRSAKSASSLLGGGASCSTSSKSGTSMATPGTAGNAALVRQFFKDSAFWSASCNASYPSCTPGSGLSPRGSTVKAVIIHSGEAMNSYSLATYDWSSTLASTVLQRNSTPNVFAGYGRLLLPNVIRLPGAGGVPLDLFVDEFNLASSTTRTYTVRVTDGTATHPLKATIVWMDPPNTVLANRMLLHNLDLTVSNASATFYGNGDEGGDDANNVEQVSIANAAPGWYTVTVSSHVLTEAASQYYSIVITSGGYVHYSATTTVAADAEAVSDPMGCNATGTGVMVSLVMQDWGNDGWGVGNYFTIRNAAGSVVRYGSQSSVAPQGYEQWDKFCLPSGADYSVSLTTGGNGMEQMGLMIEQCGVYLSLYQPAANFSIAADGTCNTCPGLTLPLMLRATSSTTATKAWFPDTHYEVWHGNDTAAVVAGALTVGILNARDLCIPADGEYTLGFKQVPTDPDSNSDYYFIGLMGGTCGLSSSTVYIDVSHVIKFTVSGGICTHGQVANADGSNIDDGGNGGGSATIGFIILGVMLLLCLGGVGLIFACCSRACNRGTESSVSQQHGSVNQPSAIALVNTSAGPHQPQQQFVGPGGVPMVVVGTQPMQPGQPGQQGHPQYQQYQQYQYPQGQPGPGVPMVYIVADPGQPQYQQQFQQQPQQQPQQYQYQQQPQQIPYATTSAVCVGGTQAGAGAGTGTGGAPGYVQVNSAELQGRGQERGVELTHIPPATQSVTNAGSTIVKTANSPKAALHPAGASAAGSSSASSGDPPGLLSSLLRPGGAVGHYTNLIAREQGEPSTPAADSQAPPSNEQSREERDAEFERELEKRRNYNPDDDV